jgi:hypothetical protein
LRPYELLALGGPTASGKSQLACLLAERVGGEIISVDSMAVYRHMDVGTAKPKDCPIKHHLVDVAEPGDYFDAKLFEELATEGNTGNKVQGKATHPLRWHLSLLSGPALRTCTNSRARLVSERKALQRGKEKG